MRLIRADVVGHFDSKGTRYAVYSMDIQPNSNRLATGGGDCSVKIWNFDALLSSPDDAKEALLSTLSTHTKSVNVVRWSKDGKYLASGSDDNYILIHKYTPGAISNQTFGSSSAAVKNKETWTRCFSLQGHSMDILDLDWHSGPVDSGYTLASASVDNHIMVWSVLPPANSVPSLVPSYGSSASSTLISPKRILSGHDSFVKGLSYDPVGRYLLSSGSDNRIIVWDAENEYSILKILDEPLRNAPDKTIFRRISWSPDGQSVCVTSAQKSSKPIGMVLKRGTWESVADLVGHTSSSISTKFCTHVLQHDTSQQQNGTNTKNSAPSVSCSVALGDQNGVLSVWSTHSNRPMYVLRDICDGAITDVAWARNTTQTALACCGIDGTVVIADFAGELGRALTTAALEKHFQTLYGRNMNELQQRPVALIENTLALKYALPPAPLSTSSSIVSTNGVANGQNGQKKRIDLRAVVCSSSSSSSSNGVSANGGASPMSSFANRGANGSNNIVAQPMTAPASASNFSSASTLQQQQTTQIIGGKKRIRPVLMQNNLDTPSEVTSAAMPNHSSASAAGCAFDDFHNNNDDSGGAMDIGGDDSVMFRKGRADPPGLSHSQSAPQMPGALRQGNISQVPSTSSSSGVRSTFMPPPVGNITAAAVASVSGTTAAPSKVAAVVERVMTIRLENDETVCTVPLMAHQQVLRKVVKPAPVPFCTTNAATAISVPAVSPRFTSSGARAVSSAGASSGLGSIVLDPSIYANGASSSHGGGEFVGHHRASVPNFVLTAARLTKPALLAQLKHSGGKLSSLTLSSTSASTTAMNEGATAVGEGLWTAVVAGEVTCIAATEFGSSGAQLGGSMSGLCLVGCSDGTLHCIDLACGARVGPPIVLGGAVAYVDISTTESPPATVLLALAVTAEGEVWKWEVHPHTAKFRCAVRTNLRPVLLSMKCRSSGSQQGATSATGNSGAGGSSKDRKTVTIPAGASSSASATTAGTTPGNINRKSDGVSIRIEQCVLSPAGEVVVHLMSATGGAEGGDWQAFSYEEGAMAWTRLADMRFVLSSLFSVQPLATAQGSRGHHISTDSLPGASSIDRTSPQLSGTSPDSTSLSALQTLAAAAVKFGTKDIIGIAAAKQASSYSLSMSTAATATAVESLGSLQDITRAAASASAGAASGCSGGDGGGDTAGKKTATSMEDWSNLVTVCHAEDRLSVALSLGQSADIESWLSAWVAVCCKNLLTGRLQWISRLLIEQHSLRKGSSSCGNGIDSAKAGGPAGTCAGAFSGEGGTERAHNRRYSSLTEWIQSLSEPLAVLQRVVLPVVAQHPAVHSLLTHVEQTIEMLSTAV